MEFEAVVRRRHMVRAYQSRPVEDEKVERILHQAHQAPSAGFKQPGVHFYSIIDGAFAAMLILLTVVDEGLGCCFVGAFHDDQVSRVLGLPEAVQPIGIIPIGYPAEPAQKYRRLPEDVLKEMMSRKPPDKRMSTSH